MQCPDCGAPFVKEDEFCGECGRRLSWETAGDSTDDKAWVADQDSLEDLAGDLFEPPLPEPALGETKPQKANMLPIVIAVGVALLLLSLGATVAIVWFLMQEEPAATPPATIGVQKELAATPLATVEMIEPGALLYQDDFDGLSSAWSWSSDEDTIVGYADGAYHIGVYRTNYMAWGSPVQAFDFDDLIIEVDVRQVAGPLNNAFGVLVRYQEDDEQYSYYWFQISGDGFYSVDLMWEDEWSPLVGWEPSTAIHTGLEVTNRIRVVCSGGQFSLYANGVHLVDLVDDTLGRGSIGLAAGALEESGVMVEFDDLRVYEPGD